MYGDGGLVQLSVLEFEVHKTIHSFLDNLPGSAVGPLIPWYVGLLAAMNWLLLAPLLVISVQGCPGGQWR